MRQLIYHCRRIKRRIFEISEITDLTHHETQNLIVELEHYIEYMQSIDLSASDYFWNEYEQINDDLRGLYEELKEKYSTAD